MNEEVYYNVMDIERGTTVDGPGLRTAIYLTGCSHHCPGCHNPSTWDPQAGKRMSLEDILSIIKGEGYDVTLTGGDPLMHPESTALLVNAIARAGLRVWLYTGYTAEEILADRVLRRSIAEVDVIVEGRFVKEKHDPDLLFRGSSNQRILTVVTAPDGDISFTPWHDPFDMIPL